MSTIDAEKNSLEGYRVLGPDNEIPPDGLAKTGDTSLPDCVSEPVREIPQERRPWKRVALYKSDVCFVAHLTPVIDCRPDSVTLREAKAALFRYMRRLYQGMLEFGLVLPLATVIDMSGRSPHPDVLKRMQGWQSDQGWHRGGFAVFVEQDKTEVERRLKDLLNPTAEAMVLPEQEPRDLEWYAQEVIRQATGKGAGAEALAQACANDIRAESRSTAGQPSAVSAWWDKERAAAQNLAQGNRAQGRTA